MSASRVESPYRLLKLSEIHAPRAPRGDVTSLMESVRILGVLHAPVVAPAKTGDGYRLIAGAGRLHAAKKAGATEVWCHVLEHVEDSPIAQLAFLDENLMRSDHGLIRDEQWNARAIISRKVGAPSKNEKLRAAGRKGGRGNKKAADGPELTRRTKASDAASEALTQRAKDVERGIARVQRSDKSVLEMYGAGELKQTQVDELVKLAPEKQAEIAPKVVGKTRTETREIVQAERAAEAAPMKEMRALFRAIEQADRITQQLSTALGIVCDELSKCADAPDGTGVSVFLAHLGMCRIWINDTAAKLRPEG